MMRFVDVADAAALPKLFSHLVVVKAVGNNMGEVFCCCWVLVDTTVVMSVVFHQTVPLHWPSKL